ncbi:helix-turn-helix domain-containing protein, partial [Alistipes putredinis]|uniref:helix-turn-helix domain-containing protein n=1 Tax=Alistipes putredinis TaxID=28117 RepID=UPI00242CE37E
MTISQIEIAFLYRYMTIFNFLSKLMDTLIDRIKMIIEAKGYSPRAFAIAIGFNYSTLNNYLTGRRSTIDSELIEKALTSFDDISAEWLLRGKGDILIQKEETEPGMDKLKSIVY